MRSLSLRTSCGRWDGADGDGRMLTVWLEFPWWWWWPRSEGLLIMTRMKRWSPKDENWNQLAIKKSSFYVVYCTWDIKNITNDSLLRNPSLVEVVLNPSSCKNWTTRTTCNLSKDWSVNRTSNIYPHEFSKKTPWDKLGTIDVESRHLPPLEHDLHVCWVSTSMLVH